ncbi:MAG: proton-conducting transporter membrane subunit, partial [Planctomycetota bacterium]|nr:proton-conducting transporter membrane subunit [Planctomycetota bacterium]
MHEVYSLKPLLPIIVSVTAGILILLTGERHRNLREGWTLLAALIKFAIVISLLPIVLSGQNIICPIISLASNLQIQLKVDALGLVFGILASGLWIVTSFYSIGYIRALKSHQQTRYYFCFAIAISATLGIAFAANLLTLFIFYEVLTIATYPLVLHKETPEAIKAGRKYLVYTLTAGGLLLFGIALTYLLTGTVDFVAGGFLPATLPKHLMYILFAVFILGFGTKAALMPLHEWLPTAMIAPTPVSALLHAVAVVKAGVFGCLRVIWYVFGPARIQELNLDIILLFFVALTVLLSALFALAQDNLKRRLAFSTINSLALIILGAGLLSASGAIGSVMHLVNHACMKITLFFAAGAIYIQTHKENVSELVGIGRRMPLTMTCFAVGTFGLAGLPPFCGFISKWYLCLGALEADQILFLVVILIAALLDIAIFFPIVYQAFFGQVNPVPASPPPVWAPAPPRRRRGESLPPR